MEYHLQILSNSKCFMVFRPAKYVYQEYPAKISSPPTPDRMTVTVSRASLLTRYVTRKDVSVNGSSRWRMRGNKMCAPLHVIPCPFTAYWLSGPLTGWVQVVEIEAHEDRKKLTAIYESMEFSNLMEFNNADLGPGGGARARTESR